MLKNKLSLFEIFFFSILLNEAIIDFFSSLSSFISDSFKINIKERIYKKIVKKIIFI